MLVSPLKKEFLHFFYTNARIITVFDQKISFKTTSVSLPEIEANTSVKSKYSTETEVNPYLRLKKQKATLK